MVIGDRSFKTIGGLRDDWSSNLILSAGLSRRSRQKLLFGLAFAGIGIGLGLGLTSAARLRAGLLV